MTELKQKLKKDIENLSKENLIWYTIQVYQNSELAVKEHILKYKEKTQNNNLVYVACPYEEVISISEKKKQKNILKKSLFPGYIFLGTEKPLKKESIIDLHKLNKLGKVIEVPLSKEDIKKIIKNIQKISNLTIPKYKQEFQKNDKVVVIYGPFENFIGFVKEFHPNEQKVLVNINILGRETIIEFKISDIKHSD